MARIPLGIAGPNHPQIIAERAREAQQAAYLASPDFRQFQAYLAARARVRLARHKRA